MPGDRRPAFVLTAAAVATPDQLLAPAWIAIDGDVVSAVGSGDPPPAHVTVALGYRTLAPGYVDLHVHGGGGVQVNGASAEQVAERVVRIAAFHARHGSTSIVPTVAADTPERTAATVAGTAVAMRRGHPRPDGARVAGAHLEGPWLSPVRAGAQDRDALHHPEPGELHALLAAGDGAVQLVTLAPELPGALDAVSRLGAAGVVVSVGHTDADYATTRAAFDHGARHVTHLFNAMPPLHHRAPGPVGAALTTTGVSCELVADGYHVAPAVLAMAAAASTGVVLVTDATAGAGAPDGEYPLGSGRVDVRDGRATLPGAPHLLAGSTLTMDRAVRTMVGVVGLPLSSALAAASTRPAAVLGLPCAAGLAPGAPADVVVLDADLSVAATLVAGHPVHDPHGVLAALTRPQGQ
jgi:N-acetylglucosamine-6-phosphate deacetylase